MFNYYELIEMSRLKNEEIERQTKFSWQLFEILFSFTGNK
jgi:hypothetical protein